jgi:hypothetical protein
MLVDEGHGWIVRRSPGGGIVAGTEDFSVRTEKIEA